MSGITISDMPRIVEANGLRVIPVDINESKMAPDACSIAQAITPETRAIVVAHLFGNRIAMEPYAKLAREHDLILIEDCAQNYVDEYSGSAAADVSMFSFGPIKFATALGGGVFQIRPPQLRRLVAERHKTYPLQSDLLFGQRVLKYLGIKIISHRMLAHFVFRLIALFGFDADAVVASMARGFAQSDFIQQIRRQPSSTLLMLLARRLQNSNPSKLARRIKQANHLTKQLTSSTEILGYEATVAQSTFWILPICANDNETAQQMVQELANRNFDATQRSSLVVVRSSQLPKRCTTHTQLPNASSILERIVFLPMCDGMDLSTISQMAAIVNRCASRIV